MAAAVAAASGQVPGRQPSGPRAITLATHAQRHPIPMEQAADLVVQIPWPRSDVEAEVRGGGGESSSLFSFLFSVSIRMVRPFVTVDVVLF